MLEPPKPPLATPLGCSESSPPPIEGKNGSRACSDGLPWFLQAGRASPGYGLHFRPKDRPRAGDLAVDSHTDTRSDGEDPPKKSKCDQF